MTYEEAKSRKKKLEAAYDAASAALAAVEGVGAGMLGLTPDHVKASQPYLSANEDYTRAFHDLREYNAWFFKNFMKEHREDRRK